MVPMRPYLGVGAPRKAALVATADAALLLLLIVVFAFCVRSCLRFCLCLCFCFCFCCCFCIALVFAFAWFCICFAFAHTHAHACFCIRSPGVLENAPDPAYTARVGIEQGCATLATPNLPTELYSSSNSQIGTAAAAATPRSVQHCSRLLQELQAVQHCLQGLRSGHRG